MDFSLCTSLCKKFAGVGAGARGLRLGLGGLKRVQMIVRGAVTKIIVIHDAKHAAKQQQLEVFSEDIPRTVL